MPASLEMPADSPYRRSWWYRTEFRLPAGYHGRNIWLHFDGINFRANIWLNGKQIAASDQIAGTFRVHELNVSDSARAREINTLAVEVFPALPDDLGWTWVDWNPMPPDKNMGIFRDVYVWATPPQHVHAHDGFVNGVGRVIDEEWPIMIVVDPLGHVRRQRFQDVIGLPCFFGIMELVNGTAAFAIFSGGG
jgi:hypothetical protein